MFNPSLDIKPSGVNRVIKDVNIYMSGSSFRLEKEKQRGNDNFVLLYQDDKPVVRIKMTLFGVVEFTDYETCEHLFDKVFMPTKIAMITTFICAFLCKWLESGRKTQNLDLLSSVLKSGNHLKVLYNNCNETYISVHTNALQYAIASGVVFISNASIGSNLAIHSKGELVSTDASFISPEYNWGSNEMYVAMRNEFLSLNKQ